MAQPLVKNAATVASMEGDVEDGKHDIVVVFLDVEHFGVPKYSKIPKPHADHFFSLIFKPKFGLGPGAGVFFQLLSERRPEITTVRLFPLGFPPAEYFNIVESLRLSKIKVVIYEGPRVTDTEESNFQEAVDLAKRLHEQLAHE